MPQSLARIGVHLIFSTKQRQPILKSIELRNELYTYMATIFRDNVDSPAIQIGGVEDHIHALISLSRKYAVMKIIEEAKTETSKWLKKQSSELSDFSWQGGYGAFGVSESNIQQVKDYILSQPEHHKTMSFQEEFRIICERHGLTIDERYVWE